MGRLNSCDLRLHLDVLCLALFGIPEHAIIPNTMTAARVPVEERELVDRAIEAFRAIPGIARVRQLPHAVRGPGDRTPDALLEVLLTDGKPFKLAVEAKRALRLGGAWAHQVRALENAGNLPIVLVTYHCPPAVAEELFKADVNFVDLAGNTHLHIRGLRLFITGRKPPPDAAKVVRGERGVLAGAAALRVIYTLLATPGAQWRMRDLAAKAGVALGWANEMVRALRAEGAVRQVRPRGPFTVLKRGPLLGRWLTDYGAILRPQLVLGIGAPVDGTIDDVAARIRALPPAKPRVALGGTWGADALVHFYRGPRLVVHVEPPLRDWLHLLRVAPENRGPVTLLLPVAPLLWEQVIPTEQGPVAPPLVLYAELLADPDPRGQELATELIRQYPELGRGD